MNRRTKPTKLKLGLLTAAMVCSIAVALAPKTANATSADDAMTFASSSGQPLHCVLCTHVWNMSFFCDSCDD